MPKKVLVTGSSGLIGRHLVPALGSAGYEVVRFDVRPDSGGEARDVRDGSLVRQAMFGAVGVVHLGAVSRVIWGERDPANCVETNVEGTRHVVSAALEAEGVKPWIVFASSREVYGEQAIFPVRETAPLRPMNLYARTKVIGEEIIASVADQGLACAILRLSNVYGDIEDHPDRLVPAFCRAALKGDGLHVQGGDNYLDLTMVLDVVAGFISTIKILEGSGQGLLTAHLVSGRPTTLRQLAQKVIALCASSSEAVEEPARCFDVSRFVGDPTLAQQLLGWRAETALERGLSELIEKFAGLEGTPRK